MGFFDGLLKGSFKETEYGQMHFFPFGSFGRGYVVPSRDMYDRLRRQTIWTIVAFLVLFLLGIVYAGTASMFVVLPSLYGFRYFWARHHSHGLAPSGEKMSWNVKEDLAGTSTSFKPAMLWVLEISAIVMTVGSILIYWKNPAQWPIAVICFAMFGYAAFAIGRTLAAQRRTTRSWS